MIVPRLKCPECKFAGKGTTFPTKRDLRTQLLPKDSPIYWIAGYHTSGVGTRHCQECKKDYAVVFSSDWNAVYGDAWSYTLDSKTGKEVLEMLRKAEK